MWQPGELLHGLSRKHISFISIFLHATGLADINGICTPLRASICQENGQYASTQTAAHEMGHKYVSVQNVMASSATLS